MTAQAILERAQAQGVALAFEDGKVKFSGDKSAIVDLLPCLRQHRAELVQLLQARPIDQMPPDPSMAPLLALAMAYCDHIGASDKARKDWQADIAATPVEQRGELAAYLRSQLPAPMPKAMPSPPPLVGFNQPKPMPKFHIAQPWNEADKAFQAHYWQCPQCKAGGRTRGPLCPTGEQLQQAIYVTRYEN